MKVLSLLFPQSDTLYVYTHAASVIFCIAHCNFPLSTRFLELSCKTLWKKLDALRADPPRSLLRPAVIMEVRRGKKLPPIVVCSTTIHTSTTTISSVYYSIVFECRNFFRLQCANGLARSQSRVKFFFASDGATPATHTFSLFKISGDAI